MMGSDLKNAFMVKHFNLKLGEIVKILTKHTSMWKQLWVDSNMSMMYYWENFIHQATHARGREKYGSEYSRTDHKGKKIHILKANWKPYTPLLSS